MTAGPNYVVADPPLGSRRSIDARLHGGFIPDGGCPHTRRAPPRSASAHARPRNAIVSSFASTDGNRPDPSPPVTTAIRTNLETKQILNDRRICEIAGCDLPDKAPLPHDDDTAGDPSHKLQILFDQQYRQILRG